MQNIANAASNAASAVVNTATSLAGTAATYTGLSGTTESLASGIASTGAPHSHAEEHHHKSTLPPDSTAGEVVKMDYEGLAVFEEEGVRHDVLIKINQLAIDDVRHGLKEVAALELVKDGHKKESAQYYHPLRYFKVQRPMGLAYIGKIEIEEGKSIHIRCHKPSPSAKATFHSLDTRPSAEGGAVFKTGEPLVWFEY